jgi:hypothetical protein
MLVVEQRLVIDRLALERACATAPNGKELGHGSFRSAPLLDAL